MGYSEVDIVASVVALQFVPDEFCLLALDPTAPDSISISGDSEVELVECGLMANSVSSSALHMEDDSELDTESVIVVGDILQTGGSINSTNGTVTGSQPALDPLASLDVPSFSGCGGGTNLTVTSDTTLSPGVYCGGLTITNNTNVDLLPGEYIIDGGDLVIEDQSDLEGTGVVIFLTSSGLSSDIGSLMIIDHGRLRFTAPTTGTYADISIFQDRDAPTTGRNDISGSGSGGPAPRLRANGILYFPSQELYVGGDGRVEVESNGCMKIIARIITLTDDAELEIECDEDALGTAVGRVIARLRV